MSIESLCFFGGSEILQITFQMQTLKMVTPLRTPKSRKNYSTYTGRNIDWKAIFDRAERGEKVTRLCRKTRISRSVFYRRYSPYQVAKQQNDAKSMENALIDHRRDSTCALTDEQEHTLGGTTIHN